jgi:NADP-dependent 3-hydroxy acid dehydrogenase YdfG
LAVVSPIPLYGFVAWHEQMDVLASYALNEFGKIDVLVNNAGVMLQSFLFKKKIDEWNMMNVNIKGVLYGIAVVLATMREQKSGHIINDEFAPL